ncbi:alpha-amylase family glycosyl hydrolase [Janibacter sp. GXQ6167]|uniref:alpha-amylase family glycosyl hydrolase n=1 Tax=Janibacter sp. GXQ6167 TaxID=3240791 RepID=UPI00352497AC
MGSEHTPPSWVAHSIWWHAYPLGFLGADTTGGDRNARRTLRDLIAWLDYVVDLGCSGLALGPIFASSTHGYDTTDFFRIDERLGDESDFDALVAACHERGIKVMLDGVFNHVGRDHVAYREVLERGWEAPSAPLFALHDEGGQPRARTFEGHDLLVELNHDADAVRDLVGDVMTHWCARGVDAWRLDAAYAVPPRFWSGVLPRVRADYPEVYVCGEVIHGDYAQIVAESGMDAVTQYELWKATWSALNDRNLFELAHALGRHDEMLASFVPWTFLGNHDVTRIASRLDDPRLLEHALVVLMTVGGTPAIYAGDEQGYTGVKEERFGGDDQVRPVMPESPEELSRIGEPTLRLHQRLIGLRRRHSWLHAARVTQEHLTNEHLVYRVAGEGGSLVVALNVGESDVSLPAAGGSRVIEGTGAVEGDQVRLAPFGWAVLE